MDPLDELLTDAMQGEERLQGQFAERHRIGIAAANRYLTIYLGEPDSEQRTGRLDAYEQMAVQVCGIGTPFSSIGEPDLSPAERAREFLALPELAFHIETPAARRLLSD